MVDLHVHSTFSDGTETPTALVKLAASLGLTALALTDHDTVEGVEEFADACRSAGLAGLPGIEWNCETDTGKLHVLTFGVRPGSAALEALLKQVREGRAARNREIFRRMKADGIPVTEEDVRRQTSGEVVARPHFAAALVAKGVVPDLATAYERYFGNGRIYDLPRFQPSAAAVAEVARSMGGVAVVAHPYLWRKAQNELDAGLAKLRDAGIEGVEVFYSTHSPEQTALLRRRAQEMGWLATGGSDFHGANKPDIHLGCGFGGLVIPDEAAESLCDAIRARGGFVIE